MSLRRRAAPAALLLCLAGCSDPWAAGNGPGYWLLDVDRKAFSSGAGHPNLSQARWSELLEGRGFALDPEWENEIVRKARRGDSLKLLEWARHKERPGTRVEFVEEEFLLGFDAACAPGKPAVVDYTFSWRGHPGAEGRLEVPSTFGFLRDAENGRFRLLVVFPGP